MRRIRKWILITALCFAAAAVLWYMEPFTDKTVVSGKALQADALIIGPLSGPCLWVEDSGEINALLNARRWENFHLECCLTPADMRMDAVSGQEAVLYIEGYSSPSVDSYNRAFRTRVASYVQRVQSGETNAVRYLAEVPVQVELTALRDALPDALVYAQYSEAREARHPFVVASYTKEFPSEAAVTREWTGDHAMGEFAPDDAFSPLIKQLKAREIFRSCSRVRCGTAMKGPNQGSVERKITIDLCEPMAQETWDGLTLQYGAPTTYHVYIVTKQPLDSAARMEWSQRWNLVFLENEMPSE